LAQKELSLPHSDSFLNYSNKRLPVRKVLESKFVDLNELRIFFNRYKDMVNFVLIFIEGKLSKGPLVNNILREFPKNKHLRALAVLIDPSLYFVIDVDDTSLFPNNLKNWLIKNKDNLCVSYYNDRPIDLDSVITSKSFKLFFKSNKDIEVNFQPLIIPYMNIGTEIRFSKAFTVFGEHRSGESKYVIGEGKTLDNLEIPPQEFITLLALNVKSLQYKRSMKEIKFKKNNITMMEARNLMTLYISKYASSSKIQRLAQDDSLLVTFFCPNKNLHTTGNSNDKEFSLKYYLKSHVFLGDCFHNSCKESNIILLEELFTTLNGPQNGKTNIDNIRIIQNEKTPTKVFSTPQVEISESITSGVDSSYKTLSNKHLEKIEFFLMQLNEVNSSVDKSRIRANLRYYIKGFSISKELLKRMDEATRSKSTNSEKEKEVAVIISSDATSIRLKNMNERQIEKYRILKQKLTLVREPSEKNKIQSHIRYYQNNYHIPDDF